MGNRIYIKSFMTLAVLVLFFFVSSHQLIADDAVAETRLVIRRKERANNYIYYNFKLTVNHIDNDVTCLHFLELLPRALDGEIGRERIARRFIETDEDSIVSWRVTVPAAMRTVDVRPEIHALVSSSCGSQTIQSNVSSRYACSGSTSGLKISTHLRLVARNARVRKKRA